MLVLRYLHLRYLHLLYSSSLPRSARRYGIEVLVLEAHSVAGGACHHWSRQGFQFDSGAALFSGLTANADGSVSANPLHSVLQAIGEEVDVVPLHDTATCLAYPDAMYRTQLGSSSFVDVVHERWGADAAAQWGNFQNYLQELHKTAGAVQVSTVRLDNGT